VKWGSDLNTYIAGVMAAMVAAMVMDVAIILIAAKMVK
jgi:hypothetical protein